jgi:isopentenyl-diphosphate delta-isomerase
MGSEEQNRKDRHLSICLEEPIEFRSGNGFAGLRFDHDALPELDKANVSLEVVLFGRRLKAPVLIGAMTGGTPRAAEVNRRLALAAQATGVGFALGSQRPMLEDPCLRGSYAVREHAPDLRLLIGNIGAVQLNNGVTATDINGLASSVGCDAFNLHLNPLQEAIQPEGNTNFGGLLQRLRETIPDIRVPVAIKEVGAGISETTAVKLATLPIAGVETAGLGGTSWAAIESRRTTDDIQRSTGELFAQWGVPTAESIVACRRALPDGVVIASGGMRSGIDAAKALALGADAVAFALPMLKAAESSVEAAIAEIERVVEELRTAMFLTGCLEPLDLRRRRLRNTTDLTSRAGGES